MRNKGELKLVNVEKYYDDNHVVKNISLTIEPGKFVSILGPSGCGKTTILRMIAGFENLNGGSIYLDEKRIDKLNSAKRAVNTVFQNYALFPHMNVYENIAYGLKAHHKSKSEINEIVYDALKMVQLTGFEKRMPGQMSGGQKQRVSIARAIVNRPPLLLLDEPLTALDMKLRKEMRFELRQLQQKLGITFIYVTHDQEEALIMSDYIIVMNGGIIEQAGNPKEIYSKPSSRFVAEFIGETNIFDAIVSETNGDDISLYSESGEFRCKGKNFEKDELVNVCVRPDKIKWSIQPVEGFNLSGKVSDFIFNGASAKSLVTLSDGSDIKISKLSGNTLPKIGTVVYLYWKPDDVVIMHSEGDTVNKAIKDVNLGKWVKEN